MVISQIFYVFLLAAILFLKILFGDFSSHQNVVLYINYYKKIW